MDESSKGIDSPQLMNGIRSCSTGSDSKMISPTIRRITQRNFQHQEKKKLVSSAYSAKAAVAVKGKKGGGKIKFVTNKMCPYAQRTWIALEMGSVPYDLVEVALYGSGGKPDWFWKLNPKGEVPIIQTSDGIVVADSEKTLDFLAENFAPTLKATDDDDAKLAAAWRDVLNSKLRPIAKSAVLGGGERGSSKKMGQLDKVLEEMNEMVIGPFVIGDSFTVADASALPFFQRLESHYSILVKYPNLASWYKHVCEQKDFTYVSHSTVTIESETVSERDAQHHQIKEIIIKHEAVKRTCVSEYV
eukprot:jgi/Bigna1/142739/aug1.72_g17447